MLIVLSVIAFFYAYLSYQDAEILHFWISLSVGLIFIGLMVNNVIQVNKAKKKDSSN